MLRIQWYPRTLKLNTILLPPSSFLLPRENYLFASE